MMPFRNTAKTLVFSYKRDVGCLASWILLIAISGSLVVSVIALLSKEVNSGQIALGGGYCLFVGCILLCIRYFSWDSNSERRFLILILVLAAVLRLGIVWGHPNYMQLMDRAYFHKTVQVLASESESVEAIHEFSRHCYDFPVWVSRGWPFHVWLSKLVPCHDVQSAQYVNAIFSWLIVLLTWCFTTRTPQRIRISAVFLCAVIPIQYWHVLDYTYEIIACFFGMSSLLLGLTLFRQTERSLYRYVWSFLLGCCLILAGAQGGLDIIGLGVLFLLLLRSPAKNFLRVSSLRLVLQVLVIPAMMVGCSKIVLAERTQVLDDGHLNSGLMAFMARGSNPRMGGEYDAIIEQIDRVTPPQDKPRPMEQVVVSRWAYEPFRMAFQLWPQKIAKFFLIGYASGIDTSLEAGGYHDASRVFTATRLWFTPFFLVLVWVGCFKLLRNLGRGLFNLAILFMPLALAGTMMIVGETSPRYSFYILPFLSMIAGQGLASWNRTADGKALFRCFCWGLLGYLLLALVFAVMAFMMPADYRLLDLRNVKSTGMNKDCASSMKASNRGDPLMRSIRLCKVIAEKEKKFEHSLSLPQTLQIGDRIHLYMWPERFNAAIDGTVYIKLDDEVMKQWAYKDLYTLTPWSCSLTSTHKKLVIGCTLSSSTLPVVEADCDSRLAWGYVGIQSMAESNDCFCSGKSPIE